MRYGRTVDICDGACCQVFDPQKIDHHTNAAVRDTWLVFIMKGNKPFPAEYWDGLVKTRYRVDIKEAPDPNSRTIKTVKKNTRLIVVNSISINGMRQVVEQTWKFGQPWPGEAIGWVSINALEPVVAGPKVLTNNGSP
jgi:hypothetical protein